MGDKADASCGLTKWLRGKGILDIPWHYLGDVISPTIFNIVVDAVVRYWLSQVVREGRENQSFGADSHPKINNLLCG